MAQFDWVMTRWERVRVYIPGARALDLGSLVTQATGLSVRLADELAGGRD